MCGIFGIAHHGCSSTIGELARQLIKGLKRLEYRGYDSAGICIETQGAQQRKIVKRKGNVQVLSDSIFTEEGAKTSGLGDLDAVAGATCMAHTRWATHGPPCDVNSHPQTSDDEDHAFVFIHNGIVTNFSDIKTLLTGQGYKFVSETDTEVLAKLSLYLYKKHHSDNNNKDSSSSLKKEQLSFVQLMSEVFTLAEGANAMIVMSKFYPGELVVMKRGSPMICGYQPITEGSPVAPLPDGANGRSQSEPDASFTPSPPTPASPVTTFGSNPPGHRRKPSMHTVDHAKTISGEGRMQFDGPCKVFFSSDPAAIADHTKQVVYLDDNDIVHFTQSGLCFYKLDGKNMSAAVGRDLHEMELELESLSKGQYAHFMLKEIYEQVASVVNTMRGRVNFATGEVRLGGFLPKSNRSAVLNARRIMFIACGTSLNSCMAVRPLFDELCECPTAIENASDFLDRSPKIFRDDVCFFVSQSGETADVLRAMEYCKEAGAVLVGLTNTVGSSISRYSNFGAHLNCGPEIGVASTKAFSSQIVVLTLIALMLCDDSIKHSKRRAEILRGLEQLSGNIDLALRQTETKVKEVAASLIDARSFLIIGRGYQYSTCLEAALKVKELSYIHTEGINAGELKHGPLALIDETIPVVVICTKDHLVERSRAAVQQIRARKGKPIVILSDADPEVEALAEVVIRVPATVDCLQVLVNTIPMQLLAYHVAVLRGNNVDCPRNLAKSVTVQ